MLTIGIDPHKDTHQAVAVDTVGRQLAERSVRADKDGFGTLLAWARALEHEHEHEHEHDDGVERTWVVEDCRHVSGPLERFLLDHGESVTRLAPHLMAEARTHVRQRGKSDPIDALAVARAALTEGLENLPTARLAGTELEVRLLHQHHQRLVKQRTALINDLRWNVHDLWPELKIPPRQLTARGNLDKLARRLRGAEQTTRVRIARDELNRVRALTRKITALTCELGQLVDQIAPQLLCETGFGPLTTAALIGEIAGIDRFATDAQLARIAGCAPIPVSSGRTDRHRLDRGGNRQLNHTVHMIALTRIQHDPETAVYYAKQREAGKTRPEATRCLKRHLIRRIYKLMHDPANTTQTINC